MRMRQTLVQCLAFTALLIAGTLSIMASGGGGGGSSGGSIVHESSPSVSPQSDWHVDLIAAKAATDSDVRRVSGGDSNGTKYWITWAGSNENPFVAEFDGVVWSQATQVGSAPATPDNHYYPVMARDSSGTLHVFYGAHDSALRHSASPTPDSISGTWIDQEVTQATSATYPMPVVYNGTIYVFFRYSTTTTTKRPIYYVKSTDNGVTWETAKEAIDLGRADDCNEVYVGQAKKIGSDVHFVWTAGGGPGHDQYHRDLYYARFSLLDEHFYNVSSTDLGTSIASPESGSCVAYSSEQNTDKAVDYQAQVSVNGSGQPVILWRWRSSPTDELRVTNWNGASWNTNAIDHQYQANQDIEAIEGSQSQFRAYVTPRQGSPGIWILESYDNGNTWSAAALLQTQDKASCAAWIPLNSVSNRSRIKALWIEQIVEPDNSSTTTPTKNVYAAGIK